MDHSKKKSFVIDNVEGWIDSVGIDLGEASRDLLVAVARLVGNSGAKSFEVGYDEESNEGNTWYAVAYYSGARIIMDNQEGPVEAAAAMAARILTGGLCRCGKTSRLFGIGMIPSDEAHFVRDKDGSGRVYERRDGYCDWSLEGDEFKPGCAGARSIW